MKPEQQQKINQILNPPLGKKPNLNQKQMKTMRMILQFVTIPQPKNTYFYNIVQKQTNLGFSSNQRFLLLNVEDKSLSYLSKIPQGYLPYTNYEEIKANKGKQQCQLNQVDNFRCTPVKGKISTMVVEWVDKEKKEKRWVLTLGSSKLMNDWIALINSVKDNSYNNEKYDQMNKINQTSPLTSNMQLPPQNTDQNKVLTKSQGSLLNKDLDLIKNSNNGQLQNPLNSNLSSNFQNKPNSIQNSGTNSLPINSNIQNNQPSKNPNEQNINNANAVATGQSALKPQPNNLAGGELQFSRKPKIPKIGESSISNVQPITFTNNYNTTTPNNNNQFLSNETGHTAKVQNIMPNSQANQMPHYLHPNDINFGSRSTQKQEQKINSTQHQRSLLHNPSEPPGDFVEELKKKRQKNPELFVLNNQLSKKKLDEYNAVQPQEQSHHPGHYNTSESYQPPHNFISNEARQGGQSVPSQHFFNRQNSGDKKSQQSPSSKQPEIKLFSKTKTNSNIQSVKDINANQFNKELSRSQISKNINLNGVSSGVNNNFDDDDLVDEADNDNYQVYKPTTSFPQSTKNLNKIRSDYLQRKAEHTGNYDKFYPSTSKHQSRLLKNNYMENQSMSKDHKFTQPPFQKITKFDSTQKKRQDSLNNLNKVNTTYLSTSKQKIFPSYNELWLQTSNPNKKLEVYDQFVNRSREIVKQIIEEIPYPKSQRQFKPIDSYQKENLYTFLVQNLIIKLHFFGQQESINGSDDNINVDAPVIYDHTTYEQIKREFYNYNLILGVTNNEGKIKVPLCCYVQYCGVLALVEADIPQSYKEIEAYSYRQQFEDLQNIIKVRFLFNTFNCYECQGYRGSEGRFIVLWNLKNLIPGIPNNLKNQSSYFRKELLLQYDEILQDLESSSQAHAFTLKHIVPQIITKLESLQMHLIHSKDLMKQLHKAGLSLSYLPELYKNTSSIYLKRIFMSEIVAGIFAEVVRSELNHAYAILPAQNMQNVSPIEISNFIVACAHVLVNDFFSYTLKSQNTWKVIVNEASKRYRIIVSKDDVIAGYLLSAIVYKLSVECDFKQKLFLKQKKFFVHENILPRQVFITFVPKIRRFDMEAICPTYSKCKEILQIQELSVQNYEHLSMILNLKNKAIQLPEYYGPLLEELKTYLANYIPYSLEQEYEYLDVYEFMYEEPITYNGIKTAFLAIKWLIKSHEVEKANQVFEIKFHELSYWLNEYNTAITEFYDFFSMFYASIGDFEESICLAKSSLINITKVLSAEALPVADKHYQLGNIYFKINKKNEALKQYNKTKQILIAHDKTKIPEYGIILLKISLLCLNFGQLIQCLANAIEAEKIFQSNGGNQNEEIQCFQILSRVYQISRNQSDMSNLCEGCSKTFNTTENPKIMQRMLKIILLPKLFELPSQGQKSLLPILYKLQQQTPAEPSLYLQSFNYLHRMALKNTNIKKKLYYFMQNVVILVDQINRRDLIRKHTSFNDKTNGQGEQMLVIIEAVGNMIGWSFFIGPLKQGWYD